MAQVIYTAAAPAAIGPYSQAVKANGMLFTSGQIGIVPATGKMAEGLAAQAEQVMQNLAAVLTEAGTSFEKAVKTTDVYKRQDHKSIMDVDDGGINLTGEEIDILGVADCQIAVNPSQRGGHQYTLVLGLDFHG